MDVDTSTIFPGPLLGALHLLRQNKATIEITLAACAFLRLAPHIWSTTATSTTARVHKMNHGPLILHAASSLVELTRYYILLSRNGGQTPVPSGTDLALCIVQGATSMYLAALIHQLPRGHPQSTRATFDCMALQRFLASGLGYYTSSPMWHRASIKLLHNFVWARFIIRITPDFITGLETFAARYTAGIIGCHLLGLWEGEYPNGTGIYMGLMAVLLAVDRGFQGKKSSLASALTTLGIVTRPKEPTENGVQKAED